MCFVSWKWVKKAIFNLNSLKILASTLLVAGLSFLLRNPLFNLGLKWTGSNANAMVIELVGTVVIDAVAYLSLLILLKEDLISSFFRKKENTNA